MRRYLLVLDTDLPVKDEDPREGPVSYLAARHDQAPSEVVVLSLAGSPRGSKSTMELLLGAGVSIGTVVPVLSRAPRADHNVSTAAEHRMRRVVQHLRGLGFQASGIISDSDLLEAVRAETRAHDYDQVILATGHQGGTRLARGLRLDPIHQLRRRWGERLVIFAATDAEPKH